MDANRDGAYAAWLRRMDEAHRVAMLPYKRRMRLHRRVGCRVCVRFRKPLTERIGDRRRRDAAWAREDAA